MNLTKYLFTLVFTVVLQYAYCDLIPMNTHSVSKCVKITNINEFDNLTLLGYIRFLGESHEKTYEVTSTDCLIKGYKLNTLSLFAVNSGYLTGKDINAIDLPNDNNALKANIEIEPQGGYYNDSIPFNRIEEYYKILGFTDTSLVIFKWKEVFGFNNGNADSILTYNYTGDVSLYYKNITKAINNLNQTASDINLYPNPTGNNIQAEISNPYIGQVNIQLLSPNGKIVSTTDILKSSTLITTEFSTSDLMPGIYILNFRFGEAVETKQIVIK